MASTINPTLKNIQSEIAGLDVQAKKDQSVKDADIKKVIDDVDTLSKTGDVDKNQLSELKDKLASMQSLVAEPEQGTADSNAKWSKGFADINKLLGDMGADGTVSEVTGGHGVGTAFKGLTADQAATAGLPDAIAKLQMDGAEGGAQQVNKVQDGAGKSYYVTSGNGGDSNNYTVYDESGTKMGTMKAPGALGLNDGKTWLALSKNGVGDSWTTTDTKSLPADAQLYDLNGAAENNNQIVTRTDTAGAAATAADSPGANTGTATLSDDHHSAPDNKDKISGSEPRSEHGSKFWAGSKDKDGTVYANVSTPTKDGANGNQANNKHWLHLSNEKGEGITPDALNRGQNGSMSFTNGSQYIAKDGNYFMVAGGTARNIVTGEEIKDPKAVADIVASAPAENKFTQADQEAGNKKRDEDLDSITL